MVGLNFFFLLLSRSCFTFFFFVGVLFFFLFFCFGGGGGLLDKGLAQKQQENTILICKTNAMKSDYWCTVRYRQYKKLGSAALQLSSTWLAFVSIALATVTQASYSESLISELIICLSCHAGEIYLAFFNLNSDETVISTTISDIAKALPGGNLIHTSCTCTELWTGRNFGVVTSSISMVVQPHGSSLFTLNCT